MNTHDTNALVPFRAALFGAALLVLPMAQAAEPAIEKLREQVNELQSQVTNLTAQIATLESNIGSLQAPPASLLAIAPYVSLENANGLTAVRFTGVNLQVVNGKGSTATANGTGNLIVGYDEADTSGRYRCTLGMSGYLPVDNEAKCVHAGGRWLNTGFKTGSHYLVAGSGNNYSRWGGIIAGFRNTNNFDYASVSDGYQSSARADYGSMSGRNWYGSDGANLSQIEATTFLGKHPSQRTEGNNSKADWPMVVNSGEPKYSMYVQPGGKRKLPVDPPVGDFRLIDFRHQRLPN